MSLAARGILRMSAMRNALMLSGLFVIVLVACGIWLVAQIRYEVRRDIDTDLLQSYRELFESGLTREELLGWFETAEDEFILASEGFMDRSGTLYGPLQSTVFTSPGFRTLSAGDLFQPEMLADLRALAREAGEIDFLPGDTGGDWRVYVGPLVGGQVALFDPITGVEDALALIPRIVLTVCAALVLTTLVAGYLLARRQQNRLDVIHAAISRIGRGDLGQQIAPGAARDDLDEIMQGIDDAAENLGQSIGRMRLFSQNMAHELRTPLARLRAALESTPDSRQTQEALDRTDEVIRTLDAVQRIARLSHKPDPGSFRSVDLAEVAALTEDLFAEVADANGQTLEITCDGAGTVLGDFQLIAQMVSNLVENALRYAGSGAVIRVAAAGRKLQVSDTGPGLPPDQIDRLFEPFERQHGEQDHGAGQGTGLGLALVRTIAEYHGASLTCRSQAGLGFDIDFPKIP